MSPSLDLKSVTVNGHGHASSSHRRASNGINGIFPKPKPTSDGFNTLSVHVGSSPDPATGAVIPSISLSTTYAQAAPGLHKGFEYSRSDNPNRNAFEKMLASIEKGGEDALCFGSGSAATGVVVQALGNGAHVLCVNDVYGGTYRYLKRVASEIQSIEVTLLDLETVDEEVIRENIQTNTKLIWLESPTNPTLKLMDVSRIAQIAQSHPSKPLLLVDNTFLSPFYSSPLLLGADVVLHSLTKYVNGHSDVVMGALILPPSSSSPRLKAFKDKLRFLQNATGAIPSPYDCWLAQRGAKTLGLRMRQHGLNALKVAKILRSNPLHAVTFLTSTRLFTLAESLGGVESLAEHPASMTHAGIPKEERETLGITDGLVLGECDKASFLVARRPVGDNGLTPKDAQEMRRALDEAFFVSNVIKEVYDDLPEDVRELVKNLPISALRDDHQLPVRL
ncbi:hypothetical protein H1R20_g9290, partial [Candolleomyces eurysporus]